MSLDSRTVVITQISAAAACNALAALRLYVTEALTMGLSPEEIQEILGLPKDIQQQPITHVTHLIDQLLRETKKTTTHKHSAHCDCGGHHV
jgi:Uncharacterized homolog of gamma-carboxymuconolactone decarboxylase subunit